MADIDHVKCAKCDIALERVPDPNPENRFVCPSCSTGDTFDNIQREVGEYAQEIAMQHFAAEMRDMVRGKPGMDFEEKPRPKKVYRFVIDLNL